MKSRQKLIGAAAAEPEQLASEFLVILPQCVAPLPDRKRQAGLAGQKVQHVDANDCKFAGRTDDLCKRIRCLPGEGKTERRQANRGSDHPGSPCNGQDAWPAAGLPASWVTALAAHRADLPPSKAHSFRG